MTSTLLTATAGPHPINVLALALAAWAVVYLISCARKPMTRCGSCAGTGKRGGTRWRTCGRCAGRGHRERLGHRIWTTTNRDN